jgi:hypothetical protein
MPQTEKARPYGRAFPIQGVASALAITTTSGNADGHAATSNDGDDGDDDDASPSFLRDAARFSATEESRPRVRR